MADRPFHLIHIGPVADDRSAAQRVADVLAESHREDTSHEFRLGLLQGALSVAMPDLLAEAHAAAAPRIMVKPLPRTAKPTKRKRRHA